MRKFVSLRNSNLEFSLIVCQIGSILRFTLIMRFELHQAQSTQYSYIFTFIRACTGEGFTLFLMEPIRWQKIEIRIRHLPEVSVQILFKL